MVEKLPSAEGVNLLRTLADELEKEGDEIRALMARLFDCLDPGGGRATWCEPYRDVIEEIERRFEIKYPG